MKNEYTKQDMEDYANWIVKNIYADDNSLEKWEQSKIKNEVWKPEISDIYYYIDCNLYPVKSRNNLSEANSDPTIRQNNCFETKEQAKQVPIKLFMAMWAWKMSNDDIKLSEFVWYIHFQLKDSYSCTITTELLDIYPYFSTEEKAKQCLKWLKKEGLI